MTSFEIKMMEWREKWSHYCMKGDWALNASSSSSLALK